MKTIGSVLLALLLLSAPEAVQAQFTYTTNNGAITIAGYAGADGAVVIPANINGLPVGSIGENAFALCTAMTNVTIPGSVTNIGAFAFLDCVSLTGVRIPGSVTSIGDAAFEDCFSLAGVTLSNGVARIGDYAFGFCPSLARVTIPRSVTNIGDCAFFECLGLAGVYFEGNAPTVGLDVFNHDNVVAVYYSPCGGGWGTNFAGLPAMPQTPPSQFSYTTNAGAIAITGYSGSCGSVIIPSTINGLPVNSIGDYAFDGDVCTILTSVTIPGSVTSVGYRAFAYGYGLTNVTLGSGVTKIGDEMFVDCSLASVTIPTSVTGIGEGAFDGTGLTNVMIPDSVTDIGERAFGECTGLTAIKVGPSNASYSSVNGVLFDKSQCTLVQYPGGASGSYTVSSSATTIGAWAFFGCYGLTGVTIPGSVTNIGNYAFEYCAQLTNATVSNGVKSIGQCAFIECESLTSVTIPGSVSNIGDWAFGETGLTSVTIPNSVTHIGEGVFFCCGSLTNATIGDSVASIGEMAFEFCPLVSVTIPASVTSIGGDAFVNCAVLTNVYFQGNAPSVDSTVFEYDSNLTVYYLPGSTGWDVFSANTGLMPVLWNPLIQTDDGGFGIQGNQFGFKIAATANLTIVVEACTNLSFPVWIPVQTNTFTGGSCCFSEGLQTVGPGRFYRIRSP